MTCEPTILDCRTQGALLPDTRITFTEDDVTVDPSGYTWQVEAAPAGSHARAWNKTTGITTSGTEVIIGWAVADLGALSPGTWLLEVTGTISSRQRKATLQITIDPEIA